MTEYSVEKFYNEYSIKQEDTIIAVIDSGSNARKVCDLLNKQDERIKELEEENRRMKSAFKRKYDYDIAEIVDEVYDGDNDD